MAIFRFNVLYIFFAVGWGDRQTVPADREDGAADVRAGRVDLPGPPW